MTKFGLILAIFALHLSAPAWARPASSCELETLGQIAIPEIQSIKRVSPGKFQSNWRNEYRLWRNRKRVLDLVELPARYQCYGTCYLYAPQSVLQSSLHRFGLLDKGDYLINFIPVMHEAWARYQTEKPKKLNLDRLVSGGNGEELLSSAIEGSTFYVDAKTVNELGGPVFFEAFEKEMIEKWALGNLWRFWNPKRRLRELLSTPELKDLETQLKDHFEKAISKKLKRPFQLQHMKLKDIQFSQFSRVSVSTALDQLLYGASNSADYEQRQWVSEYKPDELLLRVNIDHRKKQEQPTPSIHRRSNFREEIVRPILDALSDRRAVEVSIKEIFAIDGDHSYHAVVLTGVVLDGKGRLQGFKYLNSAGGNYGAKGFGYISLEEFAQYFVGAMILHSFQK